MNPVNVDAGTIDRMVREVLNQLQPAPALREVSRPEPKQELAAQPEPKPAATTSITLPQKVITADMLHETTRTGHTVLIGRQAILTPSAQDYLRKHRLTWERIELSAVEPSTAAKWRVLLSSVNDSAVRAIEVVCQKRSDVRRELTGGTTEAVSVAVSAISRAEVKGVIIVTTVPHEAACRANRHSMIRAAATDLSNWTDVETQLRPNVVCISPVGRSFMELQNVLNKVVSGRVPELPPDW